MLNLQVMQKRTVRSDFGEVSIRQEGIVTARVLHGVDIDLKKAKTYHELVEYLTNCEPHCTVVDLSGISSITPEARHFMQQTSSEWGKTISVALITNTFTSRVLANFFLSVNKPAYPIRVFNSTLEANHWVKEQYEKHNRKAA